MSTEVIWKPSRKNVREAQRILRSAVVVEPEYPEESHCDQCDLQALCCYLHGPRGIGCKAYPQVYKLPEERRNDDVAHGADPGWIPIIILGISFAALGGIAWSLRHIYTLHLCGKDGKNGTDKTQE